MINIWLESDYNMINIWLESDYNMINIWKEADYNMVNIRRPPRRSCVLEQLNSSETDWLLWLLWW